MQQALFDTMARQVADRCQAQLDAARAEADRITGEARARAEQRLNESLAAAKHEVSRLGDRARQLLAIEAEHESLTIEQSISDEILKMVGSELEKVATSPKFPEIFDSLLAEVMTIAPKDAIVTVPSAFADRARAWMQQHGHGGVTVQESSALRDGCAMQDVARTYRVTNTLSSRLNKIENDARKVCLETLFGKGGA
ncbi:MAG TPA: V-type ATP synthase subunit E [Candidatus Hydrogenedentes bacterium]|nr:V-type ATP synthase subunit E [Candidatus Hydrogenedentota bacterium]HRK34907.1 V-type ATP synthase subunit E [Candidatus Hydrogenedentota bacterium]